MDSIAATHTIYDSLVEIYKHWDKLMPEENDVSFFARYCSALPRPVVDLGVGWGRVAQATAPDYAVDYSSPMIEAARSVSPSTVYLCCDLDSYRLPEKAATSYAAGNTFETTVSDEELDRIFANIFDQTLSGGVFIFDSVCLNLEAVRERSGLAQFHAQFDDTMVHSIYELEDETRGIYRLRHVVETLDADGFTTSKRYTAPIQARRREPRTFLEVAERCGWLIDECFGGFEGQPLTPNSRRSVWVLRRP